MFDKKVSLEIPDERKIIKKRIGGKEIQMYDAIEENEIILAVGQALSSYSKDTFQNDKDMYLTPIELYANLDILITQLCTNIDVENFDFNSMCSLGLHDFLKKNLKGYSIAENAVKIGVQHVHTYKTLEVLDHVASIDELEENEEKLKILLEDGIPENVRDLILAQLVDSPSVGKFYDEFNAAMVGEEKDGLDK
jgi:hypothetical protein